MSSAFDLTVFGRAGLPSPEFAEYCARAEAVFPARDGGTYPIVNTNRLLTGADGVVPYRGLIGVKNGYTSHAGNTLVAAARRDGRTLVATVMNPRSDDGHAVYEEARALLDWGFEAADRLDPVGSLDALRSAPPGGPQADAVTVPASREDDPDDRPVWWTVTGAGLLGGAGVAVYLRLRWGPVPKD
ncbi:hypothetical protein STREPTOSP366_05720 [Streptomyces variabilis]